MPESGTVLSDGVWFALGSGLAVVASVIASLATLHVERKRRTEERDRGALERGERAQERKDERQRWADERQDRATEREDRERERRDEASQRWDPERHVVYAALVTDVAEWRERVAAVMQGQDVGYPSQVTRAMTQAELLMGDEARRVWTQALAELVSCTQVALDLMDAEPDEVSRRATASDVLQAMRQAQENTRAALRAELGLAADGE